MQTTSPPVIACLSAKSTNYPSLFVDAAKVPSCLVVTMCTTPSFCLPSDILVFGVDRIEFPFPFRFIIDVVCIVLTYLCMYRIYNPNINGEPSCANPLCWQARIEHVYPCMGRRENCLT